MKKESLVYQTYVKILEKELIPAMGCTEPIAIAFGAAKAREVLGVVPEEVLIEASGNIIKNVKSVIVPHTGGLRGLESAAAVGILHGDAGCNLEVISKVTKEQEEALKQEMTAMKFTVRPLESDHVLDFRVTVSGDGHKASVQIQDEHTNIVKVVKDDEVLFYETPKVTVENGEELDYGLLSVLGIVEFAETADLDDVREVLQRQIDCNTAIAREGLRKGYGAKIGKVLLMQDATLRTKAKAMAAAGSDARMNGCDMPVVINSGSGNQGLTTSLPVITYAQYYEMDDDDLLRGLLVSNLVTLHLKTGIGRLSAYCGAVSAGAGAGAGIAWLLTKNKDVIQHTIVNALAITSGIVCDGAKASCAAKISMAVEAGILGFEMYQHGSEFVGGDGLVSKGVEKTIANIAELGHDGMKETDRKIIEIMTK